MVFVLRLLAAMQITVDIILGGKRITLDVASTDNISSVKAKIKETEGIPIEQQYLYYDSRLLLDTDILEHCGVKNDDTLRLVNLEGLEQVNHLGLIPTTIYNLLTTYTVLFCRMTTTRTTTTMMTTTMGDKILLQLSHCMDQSYNPAHEQYRPVF